MQNAGIQLITVVTGGSAQLVEDALAGYRVTTVFNPKYSNGEMLFSIQTGLASLPANIDAALVTLGDQPQIHEKTVVALIDLYHLKKAPMILPSYEMHRGHPWLIDRSLWPDILKLDFPATMRDFFRQYNQSITYLEVDSASVLSDLDTPEDYEKNKPAVQG